MANLGFEVLEFDASIENSPYPHHKNIKFFKKFVGAEDKIEDGFETIALTRIIDEMGFDAALPNILQCDIENAEWEILEKLDISVLARYFPQVLFEFHALYPDDAVGAARRFEVLKALNEHFAPIWVHYNTSGAPLMIAKLDENTAFYTDAIVPNFCKSVLLPYVPLIEVAYIRKDLLPKDATRFKGGIYRLNIDSANSALVPDVPVIFPLLKE